jgi:hypothetical protein
MKREIDLRGPQGNAYCLMAMAETWGKQLGYDTEAIIKDMTSSDYEHLLKVFEEKFGTIVELKK